MPKYTGDIRNLIMSSTTIIIGLLGFNSVNTFDNANAQIDAPITIDIYETQFIPIDDATSYLAVLVNYTTNDPSLVDSRIQVKMESFAPNGTLV
ncbi:hypothetical protein NMY3_03044 [Candidatus Nitrosocosmicus oleophilus]|uniref:Uncharacterized protein n=1 Tax=Candidatus Nitrosocosmicus oleophilus TaxID=1353260 RepID=A0A654M3V5_9ARCH|nr:hypothetical protein [Candidatus Nitrosocosmicus oleophilus]ALI37231.1 hypothetical protein NMY3_03044 [Candidatus Nitrosocosmicus oleophilus]